MNKVLTCIAVLLIAVSSFKLTLAIYDLVKVIRHKKPIDEALYENLPF